MRIPLEPLIDLQPQENFKLRDQNDDLNAEILSLSLYEAKNLFSCQTKAQCLAAEIDNASKDEVGKPLPSDRSLTRYFSTAIYLSLSFSLPPSRLHCRSAGGRPEGAGGDQPASEAVHGQNYSGHPGP